MRNGDTEESFKTNKKREKQRTIEHQSLMREDDALKASSKEAIVCTLCYHRLLVTYVFISIL